MGAGHTSQRAIVPPADDPKATVRFGSSINPILVSSSSS
jgi:hypothetical protein